MKRRAHPTARRATAYKGNLYQSDGGDMPKRTILANCVSNSNELLAGSNWQLRADFFFRRLYLAVIPSHVIFGMKNSFRLGVWIAPGKVLMAPRS